MRRLVIGTALLLLGGCSVLDPVGAPTYGLVIVNDSDESVFWSIEQPTGETSRLELEPCSAMSESIEIGRDWEVEWGATFAVTSDDVRPLDAPVTVIHVRFDNAGEVNVADPQPAAGQPDAPIDDLTCVVR